MEYVKYLLLALFFALFINGCSDDSSTGPEPPSGNEEATAEQKFVYNAMNYWYYWQGEVPDLADDRFANDEELEEFLTGYSDAEALFDDLQYIEDDFSFFIDDYEEYQDEQDGIFSALGFNYGFIGFQSSDLIVGYVRYIIPDTPADDAGLERLDLFTEVDGTALNDDNYLDLLTSDSPHELTLAEIESGSQGVTFPETGTVNIASERVVEDPIYLSTVIDTNNVKIGYMMYNAFQSNSHKGLNDAFNNFKTAGIDELVLDLRYNGGGAVITSQLLSSLVSGLGSSNVFAEFSYNEKRSQEGETVTFLDEVPIEDEDGDFTSSEPIQALSLNHLYVLTTSSTASASEALINSLRPYIDVTIIGLRTLGKDEGSLLLVDAPPPYLDEEQANPEHKKAIQPIVLKLVNSNGEDYPNGLEPDGYDPNIGLNGGCTDNNNDNCMSEITFENLQTKPAIGNPEEPLLARAISLITGQPMPKSLTDPHSKLMQEVKVRKHGTSLRPHGNEMYIEPFMMPPAKKK